MADAAAPSLGDFFKSKGKKKVKASNLNKAEEAKTEDKKKDASKEDEAWKEDEVIAATIKVAVVGKLIREEEKVEEVSAPTWNVSKKEPVSSTAVNEKRYPTLAKAVGSSSINIDDGSDAKVNITTSKNRFADLSDGDEEEATSKRPKSIKPAHVTKKQGEREDVALKREVDKYKSKPSKKKSKEANEEDDDEEDEEEEDEAEDGVDEATAEAEAAKKKARDAKKEEKKAKKVVQEDEAAEEEQLEEDLKIQVDLVESKDKYKGRKKLPPVDLPKSELEKQKVTQQQNTSGKKKRFVEEETEKKLEYADW